MNSTVFLFPGQGSQYVGMGESLVAEYPQAAERFAQANDIMERDIREICFQGPKEILTETRNTQPAIFIHSVIIAELLGTRGHRPVAVAGHSLGEYSALVAAGYLTFEDGLRLVKLRGQLMFDAGVKYPGTMAAIIGMDPDALENVLHEASATGVVQAANFNSPGQIAISGAVDAVKEAMKLAKANGARLAKRLPVSGAFHSPLMEPAREELSRALDQVEFHNSDIPVYANVTAEPVTDATQIRDLLKQQLTSPVLWQQAIQRMAQDGHRTFVEAGPGKVLAGLQGRIDPDLSVVGVDTSENLQEYTA